MELLEAWLILLSLKILEEKGLVAETMLLSGEERSGLRDLDSRVVLRGEMEVGLYITREEASWWFEPVLYLEAK
eukprot:CAMPEP_0184316652 /NCGR_PEP_ID=MMETSP1049-20130417/91579_1 /TAXON_ID=77928 /ORGANISM="Proteomonas sulcata, Strain CCMP704" /LENGTH=73 /DNA_ID=CAMNT_0026635723 /DNA_START=263 /DNA_END=484 /DNA_ORIENTATION=+